MNDMLFVYIPCKSTREAEKLGRGLLHKRLVACITIVDGMHSAYFWPPGKDTIEETNESILLCKTIESKWKELEREVAAHHSYVTPEIAAIPVSHVNTAYYDWLVGELESDRKRMIRSSGESDILVSKSPTRTRSRSER